MFENKDLQSHMMAWYLGLKILSSITPLIKIQRLWQEAVARAVKSDDIGTAKILSSITPLIKIQRLWQEVIAPASLQTLRSTVP